MYVLGGVGKYCFHFTLLSNDIWSLMIIYSKCYKCLSKYGLSWWKRHYQTRRNCMESQKNNWLCIEKACVKTRRMYREPRSKWYVWIEPLCVVGTTFKIRRILQAHGAKENMSAQCELWLRCNLQHVAIKWFYVWGWDRRVCMKCWASEVRSLINM